MAGNKEKKKKERERRVAKEKLAAQRQRKEQAEAAGGTSAATKPNVLANAAQQLPKIDNQAGNARHTFARRRSVG